MHSCTAHAPYHCVRLNCHGMVAHSPGNLLKTPDGRLAYLDFGMCGELDQKVSFGDSRTWAAIQELRQGLAKTLVLRVHCCSTVREHSCRISASNRELHECVMDVAVRVSLQSRAIMHGWYWCTHATADASGSGTSHAALGEPGVWVPGAGRRCTRLMPQRFWGTQCSSMVLRENGLAPRSMGLWEWLGQTPQLV
jgi:hypothetical protein